jgi:cytochrome c1
MTGIFTDFSMSRFVGFLIVLMTIGSCNFNWNPEHPQVTRGKNLYGKYCVECHGVNGKGVKSLMDLYDNVDLTKINQRRDSEEFPVLEIAKYIDGRQHYKDFGSRPMPMWGVDLMELEHTYNPDTARTNLGAIISYLITLQE